VEVSDGNPVVALRSVTSSYQIAVENRATVAEDELDEDENRASKKAAPKHAPVTQGPVKKVSPFPKADGTPSEPSSNGKPNATPQGQGKESKLADKPAKAAKVESAPKAVTITNGSAPKPAAPSGRKAAEKPAQTPVVKATAKVEATPKATLSSNGSKSKDVAPAESKGAQKPAKAAVKPEAKAEVASTPAITMNGSNGKRAKAVKPSEAPALRQSAGKRSSEKPATAKAKAETSSSAPKQKAAKVETSKVKPVVEQPRQPSLLPNVEEKPAATPPRRDQKLAAVTSVKRPKK
jgi:hypothetical protein